MTYYVDLKVGGRWEVISEYAVTQDTPSGKEVTMMVRVRNVSTGKTIEMPFSQLELLARSGLLGSSQTGTANPSESSVGDLYYKSKKPEKPEPKE